MKAMVMLLRSEADGTSLAGHWAFFDAKCA
jgi:hypothetical protein